MSLSFNNSNQFLQRALKSIPIASQTFSKSILSLPNGAAPLFAERAHGAYLWDIDDNRYMDFVSSLLCISLGYADEDVNAAVAQQLNNGTIFSLPHRLETEVAELLIELIPCAQMVRFGKNGSDATSAAIRLARAHTGKEAIGVCGYHGWHDWYIGSTTRDLGVPSAVKALTHKFGYNDLASFEKLMAEQGDTLAAIIMEPMNLSYPAPGFLETIREETRKRGIVLVFDETITGFRYSLGGAQALFGVTPDLATFGKGMANGFPLSAVVGREDIMRRMEDIFFSGTFGGETLSLAAAKACIQKLKRENVAEHFVQMGTMLLDGLNKLIEKHGVGDWVKTCGHPSWSFCLFNRPGVDAMLLKSVFLQEMIARDVLILGSHNINFSHKTEHIQQLLDTYDTVLPLLASWDSDQALKQALRGEPLKPVFQVR
ncbi:aminotransferase class III-fold pyridoxal phosphate-dependent enzyme [Aliiglaciecola sp. CAU 1673]|uniref:aminotransferase class III-fold pyridoxal phosphate-dependent enzyme n=1 Tax=Aliiglaciecola sp. CAU 1673 TaxID=3032595 RepID=UPI0023DA35C6|nr:aminotransferase class III-fold pyridoxal phosphate-dependent enzyme [Aliiglaciecola sp. CAU 1673]MDF2178304.1 aminotransferase class III-fold pyridoxal phosphate-dependent enzyme [Aliiglaciecola sp. CAU 1673]